MAVTPGTRLGVYEVTAQIGEGGMGQVYRATDTRLKRQVAIKILPPAVSADPERMARFQREAEVLASLNHPNIAIIHGLEDADGVKALVMELVEGEDLSQRIARGAVPLDEALPIARQIAEALEAAHEQGVIHRDLKPANIQLRPDGVVKVLDFGLAKLAEAPSPSSAVLSQSPTITTPAMMTGVGMILGTAAYMSPEQAKARPADKRSDVWAFGCVLYEMLSGKRAFEGEDVSDTLAAVLRGEPDWSVLPREVPAAIRTLLERCLAKDRRRRIGDISVALFVLSEPAASVASTGAVTSGPRPSRSRVAVPVAAAVVMTAAMVAAGAWALRPATVARLIVRFSISAPDFGGQGRPSLAMSPDASSLVYMARARLYLRPLSEFEARIVTGSEAAPGTNINTPVFSPDGRSLAFYAGIESAIKRVAVSGGTPVTVCPADALWGMAWDASGLIFGQGRKGIFRCSSDGGAPERLVSVKDDEVPFGPQILPGGKSLLFTLMKATDVGQWDKAQVVVESLATHDRKTLVSAGADARYLPSGHLVYALGGVVFAVAFDPERLAVRSGPVPVIEGVRRVTTGTPVAQFVTSETGAMAYFPGPVGTTTGEWALAIQDRSGMVTKLSVPPGPYVHVRASRDGVHLAVGGDDGKEAIVWIDDVGGKSAIRRLTFGGRNRFPIWSPDASRVAFQSDREGDAGIFVQRADGTGVVERLTKAERGESHVPESWSPDGRVIVFSSTSSKGAAFSMRTVSTADGKITTFADVHSREPIGPVFSPDGRWLAYSSTPNAAAGRTPDRGVFVQPFPSTGARYQIPSQILDFHPVWGPKGNELYFIPSAASGQVAVASVVTQPTLSFGSPVTSPARVTANRTSGAMRAWDVLPDGRIVGLVQPTDPDSSGVTTPQLRVVLNWFEELKQRVPTK